MRSRRAAQLAELRGWIDGPAEHSFFRAVELEPANECAAAYSGARNGVALGGMFASGDCERRDRRQTVNRGAGLRDRVRRASKAASSLTM